MPHIPEIYIYYVFTNAEQFTVLGTVKIMTIYNICYQHLKSHNISADKVITYSDWWYFELEKNMGYIQSKASEAMFYL